MRRRRRTAVRVAGGALSGLALLALFFAVAGRPDLTGTIDLETPDASRESGGNYIISIPDIPGSPLAVTQDAATPDQGAAASPLADALSIRLDGVPTGSSSSSGGFGQIAFAGPGEVTPVQVSGSVADDAFAPLAADMPFGSFSGSDPGLAGANLLSHLNPDGAGGSDGGGGGGGDATPRDFVGAPDLPDRPFPPDAPIRTVPEPSALDLFQLALALIVGLAFRRLRA